MGSEMCIRDSQKSAARQYDCLPDAQLRLAKHCDEAVDLACQSVFDHDLTFCHLSRPEEGLSKWQWMHDVVSKLWSHVSQNGLLVTVWTGSEKVSATMGIAFKKKPDP